MVRSQVCRFISLLMPLLVMTTVLSVFGSKLYASDCSWSEDSADLVRATIQIDSAYSIGFMGSDLSCELRCQLKQDSKICQQSCQSEAGLSRVYKKTALLIQSIKQNSNVDSCTLINNYCFDLCSDKFESKALCSLGCETTQSDNP